MTLPTFNIDAGTDTTVIMFKGLPVQGGIRNFPLYCKHCVSSSSSALLSCFPTKKRFRTTYEQFSYTKKSQRKATNVAPLCDLLPQYTPELGICKYKKFTQLSDNMLILYFLLFCQIIILFFLLLTILFKVIVPSTPARIA